jgi:hypothetical protein
VGGDGMTKRLRAASAAVFSPPTGDKELDTWLAPERTAAITRIRKAVGEGPTINEIRLATDIYEAFIRAIAVLDPLEISKSKGRLKILQRITKATEQLDKLVALDFFISATINKVDTPFNIPPIKRVLLDADILENELTRLANQWQHHKADLSRDMKDRRPSLFEWLAGASLPLVYERHFLRRAARSRNAKSEPSGPMVRFIEATLKELGLPRKRESIVRAFSRLQCQRDEERVKREET